MRGAALIEGVIQHHGRFAFLLSEIPGEPDAYLSGPGLRRALDGDRVLARVAPGRGGRRAGELVRVVSRARTTATGVLRRAGGRWAVVPEAGEIEDGFEAIAFAEGARPVEGHLAALRIERWPDEERSGGGTVTEVLGAPAEPRTRVRALLADKEIPVEFPEEAAREAQRLPPDPVPSDWAGRTELLERATFTIDGEDAKDFDDAVSLEEGPGGLLRLGVHIADVAHYVRRGSALDREAVRRGTSVYLPGRVIPMLPPRLSDQLCSLRPDVPRLTLTCWLELDARGEVRSARTEETVIRSRRRFTYEEVQALLDGKSVGRVDAETRDAVRRMGALSRALAATRRRRGALDFTTSEYQVRCGAGGEPLEVLKRPRLDSHRLIEEFMLAANEAAARRLSEARVPFLRRLHEEPDQSRLADLQEDLGRLGIRTRTSLVGDPARALQGLLDAARGHPFEEAANVQVIRSLKLAVYSPERGGHFGLASEDYCHFTSPIRRYPDLLVHRALKGLLAGRPRAHADGLDLAGLGARCSQRERAAAEAERKAVDLARAALLGRRVGDEFLGVVVNAVSAGVFVSLPESGATGLLRGAGAPLGCRLRVVLTSADPVTGRLEFEAVKGGMPGQVRVSPKGFRRRRRP